MIRTLSIALVMISALISRPVAAQVRDGSSSLTHVVSVTVPARVKVRVSSIGQLTSRSVPSAVKVTAASNGLALSVDANRAWVVSVSGPAGSVPDSNLQWSGTQAAQFTAITSAASTASSQPVVLTVTAP